MWLGPAHVEAEVTRRGFSLPALYRTEMTKFCESNLTPSLEEYWSESVREYVLCGGRADPQRRRFMGQIGYRSTYLDRLAADLAEPRQAGHSQLHPCLQQWSNERRRSSDACSRRLQEKLEAAKKNELHRIGFAPVGWDEQKLGLVPILRTYAKEVGFVEKRFSHRGYQQEGNAFFKQNSIGLIFYCWVDTDGRASASGRLPLSFFVTHVDDEKSFMGCGPDIMCTGTGSYATYSEPDLASYGVFALMQIFDCFCTSFSEV